MAHPYEHAKSSVMRFGGKEEDYLPIHNWFDNTKALMAQHQHRALRHHSAGIFWAEEKFGVVILNSNQIPVPVRLIAEQHVREDCGFIPSVQDWLRELPKKSWMYREVSVDQEKRPVSKYDSVANISFSVYHKNEHKFTKDEVMAALQRRIEQVQEMDENELFESLETEDTQLINQQQNV